MCLEQRLAHMGLYVGHDQSNLPPHTTWEGWMQDTNVERLDSTHIGTLSNSLPRTRRVPVAHCVWETMLLCNAGVWAERHRSAGTL